MKILEKYGDRPFKLYKGNTYELIIFSDYIWGKCRGLIKDKRYKRFETKFVELTGGLGYSCGTDSKYNFTNVFELPSRELEVFISGSKLLIKDSSINFEFINEDLNQDISEESLVELPNRRVVQYIYQFKNDSFKYIIIDKDEFNASSPSNFYYGSFSDYKSLTINEFIRYRDGGTVEISTSEGEFFSPTPFNKNSKTTWTVGDEVYELNPIIKGPYSHNTKMFLEKLNIKDKKIDE